MGGAAPLMSGPPLSTWNKYISKCILQFSAQVKVNLGITIKQVFLLVCNQAWPSMEVTTWKYGYTSLCPLGLQELCNSQVGLSHTASWWTIPKLTEHPASVPLWWTLLTLTKYLALVPVLTQSITGVPKLINPFMKFQIVHWPPTFLYEN